MMATPHSLAVSGSQRKLPSDRDIAFAATIISSKPEGISIPKYLSLLRQHIAKGRRENALSAVYRHLDRSAYWRSECERMDASRQAAEARETDALREVDLLKARIEIMNASVASSTKKRRADPDVVLYPRSPKRGRRTASPARSVVADEVLDVDALPDGGDESSEYL